MSREPFEGSSWGERPVAPEKAGEATPLLRERRMLASALLIVLGLALAGTGVATATGLSLQPKLDQVEPARLKHAVTELRESERARVGLALRSKRVLGVKRSALESIAECESGGDPRARSADGTYRGKYQFDRGTWARIGGSGDPAAAHELEQDYRAAELFRVAGSSPWPACG